MDPIQVENFDDGNANLFRQNLQDAPSSTITIVNSPTRSGDYAVKFLREAGELRNEFMAPPVPKDREYQFKWSIYVPENWATNDDSSVGITVSQIVPQSGGWWQGGGFHLKIFGGSWGVWHQHQPSPTTQISQLILEKDLKSITKGEWTDFEVRTKWSHRDDGFLKLYANGELIYSKEGSVTFDGSEGAYFKWGIYAGGQDVDRTLYGDEYQLLASGDPSESSESSEDRNNNEILGFGEFLQGKTSDDTLFGSNGDDILEGGDGNDKLRGSSGFDKLLGQNDNDLLNGGRNDDELTGGAGRDKFVFNTDAAFTTADFGVDTIRDFTDSDDKILLDKTTFKTISSTAGSGFSQGDEFAVVGSDAAAAISQADIVYNSASGKLFYNQNGASAGFGTGAHFATLADSPVISATDFLIQA